MGEETPWLFFGGGVQTTMISQEIAEIGKRIERKGIRLKDALSIIDMTLQDQTTQSKGLSPYEAFTHLNKLIGMTVHGVKIERFKPRGNRRPFHTLEIQSEERDILGYLNMIYLKRVTPCYYLVYVEVVSSFRGLGLGNKILNVFMEFVKDKRAIGLLDNIIPPEEVTYDLYTKAGWKNVKDFIGGRIADGWGNYMVFVPDSIQTHDLKNQLIKSLFSLNKKRAVIDMHDNEDMVNRTIREFRSVYQALEEIFDAEISSRTSNPLMRFMFTRLTTKLMGFRRRITTLIGYTGGESLEQISFSDRIRELPIQPYSLWNLGKDPLRIWGDKKVLKNLPDRLKEEPTFFIESLPPYGRPYLHKSIEKMGRGPSPSLKISDLLDFGFDPTRLRQFHHDGVDYIFERVSPHLFPSLVRKKRFLEKTDKYFSGLRFQGATLQTNPPLLVLRDRGNIYVLRKKVEGIHSEEALDQLRLSPNLKGMNRAAGLDRMMVRTIKDIHDYLETKFKPRFREEIEDLTYFCPWNIEMNFPKVHVDITGASLETVWLA